MLTDGVYNHANVLLDLETNIDSAFPNSRLTINDYTPPYPSNRKANEGKLFLYIPEEITSRLIMNLIFATYNQLQNIEFAESCALRACVLDVLA